MIQTKILNDTLKRGLKEAGLLLSAAIQGELIAYIELLYKWNTVHNLTAVRDPGEMVQRHVLDSLMLLPFVSQGNALNVLDVGTGAGLPGIPLAICRPEHTFVLLDSQQKKITFVQHVILSLKLRNATVVRERVEKYYPKVLFDLVVSRAFAALSEFIARTQHLCPAGGSWIAMKGAIDATELAAIPSGFMVEKVVPVKVPGMLQARTLVFITRSRGN